MNTIAPYKPEILAACVKWYKSEQKIPFDDSKPHYKTRSATSRKNWRVFSELCKANGLEPISTSYQINGLSFNLPS